MPFFRNLAALPYVVSDPVLLGSIHLIYQSAMHATRAAVYFLPYLDSPALRKRKLQIFIDHDGLAGGDTHHYQLTRAFRKIGARCVLEDEEFGTPDELTRHLGADRRAPGRAGPRRWRVLLRVTPHSSKIADYPLTESFTIQIRLCV
jgi:hypothetical protein